MAGFWAPGEELTMGGNVKLAKNAGVLMGMELGTRVMDALVSIVLARYLMPEGFGFLAFGISFASLFSIVPGFGMGTLVTREVARDPAQISRQLSNGLVAKIILCGGTLGVMGIVALVSRFPPQKLGVVMLAGLLMVMETNLSYVLSVFQGMQWMGTVALGSLAVRLGWLILSLVVVAMRGNIVALLLVRICLNTVGTALSIWGVHARLQRIRWSIEPKFIVQMLKNSFPFALFRLRGTVYTDIDTVMLSVMRGDLMTGWYASAQKVLKVLTFIPNSFAGSMLPVLASSLHDRRKHAIWSLNQSCRYLWIISLPVSAGIVVLAPGFITTVFGSSYAGAAGALQILILSVPFAFLNGALLAGVGAVNQEWRGSHILIGGALFSSLSNLVAVPLFGHLGAASTTLLAEIFILVLQVRILKKALPEFRIADVRSGLWAAALVMAACAWALRGLSWVIALAVSFGLYLALLRLLGVVDDKDWEMLRGILRLKKMIEVQE